MVTLLLCLLGLPAYLFNKYNFKRLSTCFALAALIIFLLIGYGLVPYVLARQLQTYQMNPSVHWQKNNAIVLLGGGSVRTINGLAPSTFCYSRIAEAAKLYRVCKANESGQNCTVIYTGDDIRRPTYADASLYRAELMALGVARKDILIEPRALNTYENAKYTAEILRQQHFAPVVLVSSGFHMRRALLYFNYFGISAVPAPADYFGPTDIHKFPSAYNLVVTEMLMHEYIGILEFQCLKFLNQMPMAASL